MKFILQIMGIALCIIACSSQKDIPTVAKTTDISKTQNDTIRIANDSLEYEIIIIEPGFQAWLVTQRPRGFYGLAFLENRNAFYVTNYNQRVLQPQRFDPNLYQQQINYERTTKYGYEVNYLLYNYFLFFEQRYRQNLGFSRRNQRF